MAEDLRKLLARLGEQRGAKGCAQTMKTGVGELSEAQKKKDFEDPSITAIKVKGNSATAKINGEVTALTKQGDSWLLALNQ